MKTLVNTCTVGVAFVREVELKCAAADVTVIDVPISGGVGGARAGTLAMMVSGNPAKIADLMPVFQQWGKTIVVAGDRPGSAQIMKLTNNMLCAVALVATSEAMTMSGKAGIPDDAMLEILNNGTGRNFATMHLFPEAVLPRTYDFGATIEILMKDVDLAIEQGEELGVPMWVSQAVRLVLKHGIFQGRAQQDMSRIVQIIEDGDAQIVITRRCQKLTGGFAKIQTGQAAACRPNLGPAKARAFLMKRHSLPLEPAEGPSFFRIRQVSLLPQVQRNRLAAIEPTIFRSPDISSMPAILRRYGQHREPIGVNNRKRNRGTNRILQRLIAVQGSFYEADQGSAEERLTSPHKLQVDLLVGPDRRHGPPRDTARSAVYDDVGGGQGYLAVVQSNSLLLDISNMAHPHDVPDAPELRQLLFADHSATIGSRTNIRIEA